MRAVDLCRSLPHPATRRIPGMELLFVITLIVALGLLAQAAGADTRGFVRRASV